MLLTFSGGADFSVNLSLLTTAIAASVILLYTLLGALRGAERAAVIRGQHCRRVERLLRRFAFAVYDHVRAGDILDMEPQIAL